MYKNKEFYIGSLHKRESFSITILFFTHYASFLSQIISLFVEFCVYLRYEIKNIIIIHT